MTHSFLTLLLAVTGSTQDPATVRDAERAFGAQVAHEGVAAGVAAFAAPDVVLLYGGAPVVVGRNRATALLAAQRLLDTLVLALSPTDDWISSDGEFGVAQGFLEITAASTPGRRGTYIAGWRRDGKKWSLIGLMLAGVAPPDRTALGGDSIELAPLAATGPAAAMIRADLEFSGHAGRAGAADAFRSFAAADAVVLGANGPQRGPDAIGASIGRSPPSDWSWHPVAARIAASGDLGFTVGQAVIRPKTGGEAVLSKYLTVWRRQPDGTVRFLTDGGNPRPRP